MANGFSVRISAIDAASKPIDKINKQLAAMRAPVDRMRVSLTKLSNLSGLTALRGSMTRLAETAKNTARPIASIIPGLSAITGATTIAGMFALANSWANLGVQLGNNSRLMGINVSRLHAMQGAARLMGSDAESLTSGLEALANNIQDGIAGRAPEFVRRLADMGISLKDANGNARSAADVFNDIQRVMSRYRDPIIRAQTANELFGASAARLLVILEKSPEVWGAAQEQARRYGVETAGSVAAADKLNTAQVGLRMAFEGMGRALVTNLGPRMAKLFDDLSNWVVRITPKVVELGERFVAWLEQLDWNKVQEGGQRFLGILETMSNNLSTILKISGALLGLWVGSKFIAAIAAIGRLTTAVGALAAPGALAGLSGAIGMLGRFAGPLGLLAAGVAFIESLQGRTPEQQQEQRNNWRNRGAMAPGGAQAPTGTEAERENRIYDGLISRGVPPDEAAGITANIMRESRGDPATVNPAGGGVGAHGLYQGRANRAYLPDGRLLSQGTIDEQLDQLIRERNGSERRNIEQAARGAQNAGDWGVAYSRGFERHGDQNEDAARGLLADRIAQRQAARRARGDANPTQPGAPAPRGVDAVAKPRTPGPGAALTGNARLEVAFSNPPPGMTARAVTSGGIFADGPRVSMGMPSYASA
ncbi:phage tail tip lysozyme [Siccirubricoccus sp. KC 17139]|uniref:Phage tail tip lysozyme n=1 Tax=Siccirubricoccus soli TaxID=2899147 RepID=A0ABT1CYS2_9PROT|nr:phage tail tip lysozyme [Siccirubricoccus soli]MCO6414818.1 phage tail tip lysozyme [Siccirubricoccus soli]MCP2680948.1 phage tail tip lysozyme [Siccirubricoccus soli]